MSTESEICPFKAGDRVVYKPSDRGWGHQVMIGILVPGRIYVVREILDDRYVAIEGYDHPSDGKYWTEFEPARTSPEQSPFKIGDCIVYKPSERGWGLECLGETLVPGTTYLVREIQDGRYVLLEEDPHPIGGLPWTEFEPAA